jgi:S1-C subfamily serine protease
LSLAFLSLNRLEEHRPMRPASRHRLWTVASFPAVSFAIGLTCLVDFVDPQALGYAVAGKDPAPQVAPAVGLDAAAEEVLQVLLATSEPIGSAVVVNAPRRLLATCAHVIIGKRAVTVRRNGSATYLAVDVVAVDEPKDLAILRLRDTSLTPGIVGIAVARDLPAAGATAIAIGYPLGLGRTLNRGVVSAIRTRAELEASGLLGAPDADLIQTDCPISGGNSGGALLSATGELVGITQGGYAGEKINGMFLAVAARHVAEMLDTVAADATIPWSAIAAMKGAQGDGGRPDGPAPNRPEHQIALPPHDAKALRTSLFALIRSVKCPRCDGTGTDHKRERVRGNGLFGDAQFRTFEIPCALCETTGYANFKTLRVRLNKVICAYSTDRGADAPAAGKLDERVVEELRKLLAVNPAGLAEALAVGGNAALARNTELGTPIVVCGQLLERNWQAGEETLLVRLVGAGGFVVLKSPKAIDAGNATWVLAGGRLTGWKPINLGGRAAQASPLEYPVLSGGIAVQQGPPSR